MKKNRRWLGGALIGLVLCLCLTAVLIYRSTPAGKYRREFRTGGKYLAELRYEEAVLAFWRAWDMEPRVETAQKLAEAYETWIGVSLEKQNTDRAERICGNAWEALFSHLGAEDDLLSSGLGEPLVIYSVQILNEMNRQEEQEEAEELLGKLAEIFADAAGSAGKRRRKSVPGKLKQKLTGEIQKKGNPADAIALQIAYLRHDPVEEELTVLAELYGNYKTEGSEQTEESLAQYAEMLSEFQLFLTDHADDFRDGESYADILRIVGEQQAQATDEAKRLQLIRLMEKAPEKIDYVSAYREAFREAEKRHAAFVTELRSYMPGVGDDYTPPYSGIYYTLCDLTGDRVKELIITQITSKHATDIWIYGLQDGRSVYLGESGGDTVDTILFGYRQGYLFWSEYKGFYALYFREWTGSEFQDHTLYEDSYDYWERGTGPAEPKTLEELSDCYDVSRILEEPDESVWIEDFAMYVQ